MSSETNRSISRFWPLSLRARLFFLVLIAVIPALALILYTARDQRRMAEQHALEELMRLSQLVSNEHKHLVEGTRQLLTMLAQLPAVQNQDAKSCNDITKGIARGYPQYLGLGALKPNGDRFCGGTVRDPGPINVADRDWFKRTLEMRQFTIGNYQIGRLTKKAVFPLAYPALDINGRVRAVLLAVVDLEWLKSLVSDLALHQNSSLTIIDDRGLILAHHPKGDQWVGRSIARSLLFDAVSKKPAGLHAVEGIDGVPRLAVFNSLGGDDQSGAVHLVLSRPRQEVFAESDRILRRNLLWLAVVSLAVLAAAWFGSEVFLVRQVNRLLQSAQRIAGGDFRARTGLPYHSGELGELAHSFDQMAASLEARQEEARQAEAKARESERLAAMGATVAGITHEIANPLGGMFAAVQYLELKLARAGASGDADVRSTVASLKGEIDRLRSLLQDLRFLARPGELDLKPTSVAELAAEILALEHDQYKERGIRVESDFPGSLPRVMADGKKLKQALLNLCKNAADAMPNGGKMVLRGFQSGNNLILEVRDNGVGISNEVNIFNLFATTKPHGLGLGLAIVRQIVAAHGGVISYTSEPGRETVFRLSIPIGAVTDQAA